MKIDIKKMRSKTIYSQIHKTILHVLLYLFMCTIWFSSFCIFIFILYRCRCLHGFIFHLKWINFDGVMEKYVLYFPFMSGWLAGWLFCL